MLRALLDLAIMIAVVALLTWWAIEFLANFVIG